MTSSSSLPAVEGGAASPTRSKRLARFRATAAFWLVVAVIAILRITE